MNALDDHLAIDRTGNLNSPVLETMHGSRTLPGRIITNVFSFLEEVGEGTGIELSLKELTAMEEGFASRVERAMKDDEELESFFRKD